MYLPVIIAPKNDETTASWIRRLTLANGFDNTEEFAQQFICDSDIANAQRFKAMLGTEDFISLYKALNLQGISMWDLYMKTSCYGGIAPFLSDARQTHYLNTAFRLGASNNSIVSASNSLTSELRFCPLCKKEDEVAGGWYYHRAHQMPSIKVCYKHGSILRRFTGKFGTELSVSPQSVSCTNTENSWEQDFAVFAKELLDAAPEISAENTKAAVLREVKCQGFYAPASEYAKLNTTLKNAGVYVSSLSRLFVQMYDMNYVAIDDLMRLCWFLFGTADKFISACKQVQKPTVPLQLPEGYTACSPYLVVNCVANSNFSALYASIGNAIDRALGITTSVYQKLIESRRSLGEKAEKVRELVEIFAIGIIILDEIQLIDFQSTKENSFESLMTLTNRTKVAIAVVGTEDAYSKMFTHLRTARRLGNIISGNLYCENRTYFSILAKRVFKYQWFDSPVEMTNDMLEALYRNTHGIIDQLVGLCMYLNLDYISSKSRPTIDADYINKVAKRHYRGIQKLMDELDDPLNEKKRQKIIEEADRKLDNLLQEHKQTAFAEKIMESAEADEKKIPLKKNIIHNIEMVVADYTSDRIAAAVDRVLISTDETDEKVLTRVVMKLLTDSEKETPTKKKKSKKKPLQTSDMVKFIIE